MQLLFSIFVFSTYSSIDAYDEMRQHALLLLSHNRLLYDNVIVCLTANEFFMRHVSTIKKASISLFTCSMPFAKQRAHNI